MGYYDPDDYDYPKNPYEEQLDELKDDLKKIVTELKHQLYGSKAFDQQIFEDYFDDLLRLSDVKYPHNQLQITAIKSETHYLDNWIQLNYEYLNKNTQEIIA